MSMALPPETAELHLLQAPLIFAPVYQKLPWGGRRLQRFRSDLPPGPIGESWDVADHERGMSVVAEGALVGSRICDLVGRFGPQLVGDGFSGTTFPLMIKVIDATDKLSVQVHPDDALAIRLGVGRNGKTECWLFLEDGGEVFQGTKAGIDRFAFEKALAEGRIADTLNCYAAKADDFFFLDARTVHALGAGCLLIEVQQTSDVTFRVHDWNRPGLDGKPRPLHPRQSLDTIDFSRTGFGPQHPAWRAHVGGGRVRRLADCPHFTVDEHDTDGATHILGEHAGRCSLVSCLTADATLTVGRGQVALGKTRTALVPAAAGAFRLDTPAPTRILVSTPRF